MTSNTKRALICSGLVLLLIALCFAGSFHFQGKIVDLLEPVYFARGTELSSQEADGLEQRLKANPNSFANRIELLAYYSFKNVSHGLTSEELAHRREHILWVITSQPSASFASTYAASFGADGHDPEGLQQAKMLWLQQVQANPNDSRVLYSAGRFFSWSDEWEQSRVLLERAYSSNPKDYKIASSLANLYWRSARHAGRDDQLESMAAKSLEVFEQALNDAQHPRDRFSDLPQAAQAAFAAGQYRRASALAKEALRLAEQPEYRANNSDAIHYGNIVLGRIALQQGDVPSASAYLLKAGSVQGNPHLDTFGPNMMLAEELLERNERNPILSYFDLCSKFWKDNDGKLGQWRSEVLAGKEPDFGANLRY